MFERKLEMLLLKLFPSTVHRLSNGVTRLAYERGWIDSRAYHQLSEISGSRSKRPGFQPDYGHLMAAIQRSPTKVYSSPSKCTCPQCGGIPAPLQRGWAEASEKADLILSKVGLVGLGSHDLGERR